MGTPLIPVILAGGKGERFWPVSRRQFPKQFLSLDGSGQSLLQQTAQRLLPIAGGWQSLWVITAAAVADLVRQQLPELPEENLLVEPEGRDTAPAVAWATLEVARRHGETAVLGLFPADHWIGDEAAYHQTLEAAAALAVSQGAIATLGITPTYGATGYGYIEQGAAAVQPLVEAPHLQGYPVTRFTEKPDGETAAAFVASGRYSWNSGMFIFPAAVMVAELTAQAPELITALRQQGVAAYPSLTKLSIDYAVMEKTRRAWVIPAEFGWDDLGDWNALERLLKQPGQANVALARHLGLDTEGCVLYAEDGEEAIVTIGLQDVVIVRAGKATLVVHKDRTQDIKAAVKALGEDPELKTLL